jgi:hypothetical protein
MIVHLESMAGEKRRGGEEEMGRKLKNEILTVSEYEASG